MYCGYTKKKLVSYIKIIWMELLKRITIVKSMEEEDIVEEKRDAYKKLAPKYIRKL